YTGLIKRDYKEVTWWPYNSLFERLAQYPMPPPAWALPVALDAAYQLRDLVRASTNVYGNDKLRHAVTNTLDAIGWLTLKFYFGAELRKGNEDTLAELRATLREVVAWFLDAPEVKEIYFT